MKIATLATSGSEYERLVHERLIPSAARHGYKVHVYSPPTRPNRYENALLKPDAVLSAYDAFGIDEPIWFLDADIRITRPLPVPPPTCDVMAMAHNPSRWKKARNEGLCDLRPIDSYPGSLSRGRVFLWPRFFIPTPMIGFTSPLVAEQWRHEVSEWPTSGFLRPNGPEYYDDERTFTLAIGYRWMPWVLWFENTLFAYEHSPHRPTATCIGIRQGGRP